MALLRRCVSWFRVHVVQSRFIAFFAVLVFVADFASVEYTRAPLDYGHVASTRFYAADGELLYERRSKAGGYGTPVALDAIAEPVVWATLAGEDHNFAWHPGVDPLAVVRAVGLNLKAGKVKYGGSTITQQLAKLLRPEPRTLLGKLFEARDALQLEWSLSKSRILEQYLNRAYYGRQAYGIEAAALRFFGKSAKHLTLDQAALLAILPRSPVNYDPDRFPERARERRAHVLSMMAKRGYISMERASEAATLPLALSRPRNVPLVPHVSDWLAEHVDETGDVHTSLDLELQTRIEQKLERHLNRIRDLGAEQGGVVVIDNDSARILAMVGSRDYADAARNGAVNATLAKRPAGSTLKPFIYAMAFEAGQSPETLILDAPSSWADYQPRNTHGHHHGWVPLERALGSSLNVPAVRLLETISVPKASQRLRRLGFSLIDPTGTRHGLALALGAAPVSLLQLSGAYSALANEGVHRSPSLAPSSSLHSRVFTQQAARDVTLVLSDRGAREPEFGLETPLDLPFDVAAKTGTSSSYCDNWTLGYTREVTVGVWVGNFSGKPLRGALAMEGAAPLFHDVMVEAMRERNSAHPLVSTSKPPARTQQRAYEKPLGSTQALRIESPSPDARILFDPLLPASVQRLTLRLETRDDPCPRSDEQGDCIARIAWHVDDEPALEVPLGQSAWWPITPGRHRVTAFGLDGDGAVVTRAREVTFTVTGDDDA